MSILRCKNTGYVFMSWIKFLKYHFSGDLFSLGPFFRDSSYASQIWSPSCDTHSESMERLQYRFFRSLAFKLERSMSLFENDYRRMSNIAKISSIKSFRTYQDLFLFYKVINNLLNSPELLSKINTWVPGTNLRYNINTFVSTLKICDLKKISLLTDLVYVPT